jgi:hypothetical protein
MNGDRTGQEALQQERGLGQAPSFPLQRSQIAVGVENLSIPSMAMPLVACHQLSLSGNFLLLSNGCVFIKIFSAYP